MPSLLCQVRLDLSIAAVSAIAFDVMECDGGWTTVYCMYDGIDANREGVQKRMDEEDVRRADEEKKQEEER